MRNINARQILDYSIIPSLSRNEGKFLERLTSDFSSYPHFNENYEIVKRNNCLLIKSKKNANTTIMAHTDRIVIDSLPRVEEKNGRLTGQFDNVISVVVMNNLIKEGVNYNYLFTTHEETCDNFYQVLEYHKDFPNMHLIDLDIDIGVPDCLMKEGAITSNIPPVAYSLIFKKEFKDSGIKMEFNNHWAISEIGMAFSKDVSLFKKARKNNILALFGIPIHNLHSNSERCYLASVENMITLLSDYIEIS